MTYYQILGVPPTASMSDIKRAHRDLAKQFHPDRLRGAPPWEVQQAAQKFQDIQEAYEALLRHRSVYDKQLQAESAAVPSESAMQTEKPHAPGDGVAPDVAPMPPTSMEPKTIDWSSIASSIRVSPRQLWFLFGFVLMLIARFMIYSAIKPSLQSIQQQYGDESAAEVQSPRAKEFEGTMSDQAGHDSAVFDIAFGDSYYRMSGCMAVKPPFHGSGALAGWIWGSGYSFSVKSPTEKYSFSGTREGDDISGTYTVAHRNGPKESGTFSMVQIPSAGDSDALAIENCPSDADANPQ